MAIIKEGKIIDLGESSRVVTIPKGHTLLEHGDVITLVANNVVAIGPIEWKTDRKKMKDDLKKLSDEL